MTTSESLAKARAAKLGYRLEKAPTTDMRRTSYGTYRLVDAETGNIAYHDTQTAWYGMRLIDIRGFLDYIEHQRGHTDHRTTPRGPRQPRPGIAGG